MKAHSWIEWAFWFLAKERSIQAEISQNNL